jgi:hypothetical protein
VNRIGSWQLSNSWLAAMKMLPLDDPRWPDLRSRNGDATWVAERLKALQQRPDDLAAFQDLWPWLCSEGTAWSGAYAAVPHVVTLAKRLPPIRRFEYLYFVGLVVMCSCTDSSESQEIKPYLRESYGRAVADALPLLAETLVCPHDATETRYVLAAAAALMGHTKLADVLNDLDCICQECPNCGECVYPDELQAAT